MAGAVIGGRPARRRRLLALVFALVVTIDLALPPERQASAWLLAGAVDLYQATLSPWMPAAGVRCRFTPTCSRYAEVAIRRDGTLIGAGRTLGRLLRCGPWTPAGTVDLP